MLKGWSRGLISCNLPKPLNFPCDRADTGPPVGAEPCWADSLVCGSAEQGGVPQQGPHALFSSPVPIAHVGTQGALREG